MEIPFKSDEQRKAVFANMRGGFNKKTRVRKYGSSQNLDVLKHKGPPRKLDSAYRKSELQKGIKAELEHTHSRRVAKMIAKDHLNEIPNYYSLLNQLEKKAGVKNSDIKTKEGKVFCGMCKRKGLSLKKGKCKDCIKESKKFKQKKIDVLTEEDANDMINVFTDILEKAKDIAFDDGEYSKAEIPLMEDEEENLKHIIKSGMTKEDAMRSIMKSMFTDSSIGVFVEDAIYITPSVSEELIKLFEKIDKEKNWYQVDEV